MAVFRPLPNRNSTATFLASSLGKLELYSQGDRKAKAGSIPEGRNNNGAYLHGTYYVLATVVSHFQYPLTYSS